MIRQILGGEGLNGKAHVHNLRRMPVAGQVLSRPSENENRLAVYQLISADVGPGVVLRRVPLKFDVHFHVKIARLQRMAPS